ncbi:D-alanine--D-alanine ligase [candidate division KSB1 bacterium]|nr:D-alanine--D-alanine ligase [candidate division KSB1 bacterium]
MKVAITHGYVPPDAPEDEQDVLEEARAVSDTLLRLGHNPATLPLFLDTQKMIADIGDIRPDVIFNLVESLDGKGRYLYIAPTIFDYLNIPYTGAHTDAIYTTSNKLLAKQCLKSAGIPTAHWLTTAMLSNGFKSVDAPYIIKSVWEHASIGLSAASIIHNTNQLPAALEKANGDGTGVWFAEKFIDGREFNLSVLGGPDGPTVLPPAEMTFLNFPEGKPRIVDYEAKWDESSAAYQQTVRTFDFPASDRQLLDQLCDISLQCWQLFELRGYARVDFRVDVDNYPFVLEVNVNPCISPDAGFYAACQRGGLDYEQVIERIIRDV